MGLVNKLCEKCTICIPLHDVPENPESIAGKICIGLKELSMQCCRHHDCYDLSMEECPDYLQRISDIGVFE